MTDKEQALVATAYRVAAGKAFYECDRIRMTYLADTVYEAVISLTPADAEENLRELMLEAALRVASSIYTNAEVEKIVDEVLNATK